jgi:hypothetical protein
VRVAPGPGTLLRALRTLDVAPDLRAAGGPATIVSVHRHTRAGDVWFLFNDSPRRVARRLRFATTGAPTRIDLWTGRATRLAEFSRAGAHVTVPLTLGPGATALLSFDARRTGHGRRVRPVGRSLTVTGPWALTAVTSLPGEESEDATTLQRLVPWESLTALRGRSGTGTYSATAQLPRRWLARRRGVLLDPGDFGGALRAWVNGREVPVAPLPGQPPTDVTRVLRPGANALRLEVSTSLNNAIVTLGASGDPNYAKYASRPLQASGLLGPVRLIPYAETAQP